MARAFRDQGPFDRAYDVPYTTVHTGVIHGGTALNIVPRDCSFDFEIRHLPFDDPDAFFAEVRAYAERFLPAMRAVDADTLHRVRSRCRRTPGFDTDGAQRDRRARSRAAAAQASARQGLVRHRGVAVPRRRTSRRSSAAPATSRRRTSRTSGWRVEQLARCEAFMRRLADRAVRRLSAARTLRTLAADHASPASRPPDRGRVSRSRPLGRRATPASPTSGRFAAARAGPHVLVQALTHGNEVCGAIALDWLLARACARCAAR